MNTITDKQSSQYNSGALDCISNKTPISTNIEYLKGYMEQLPGHYQRKADAK